MEEILASIRRIISEDEAPAAATELPIPPSEDLPKPPQHESSFPSDEPTTAFNSGNSLGNEDTGGSFSGSSEPHRLSLPEDEEDDGDLELTHRVETHGDLDVVAMPAPEPEPEPPPAPVVGEGLVSEPVAVAAAATFGKLTSDLLVPHSDRTLEDVVRDLLRPLLQTWLDENLPGIVQRAVDAEVERIARGRVR